VVLSFSVLASSNSQPNSSISSGHRGDDLKPLTGVIWNPVASPPIWSTRDRGLGSLFLGRLFSAAVGIDQFESGSFGNRLIQPELTALRGINS
jgi:hypothetical protein